MQARNANQKMLVDFCSDGSIVDYITHNCFELRDLKPFPNCLSILLYSVHKICPLHVACDLKSVCGI